jgi:hypothetical protein
MSICLYAITTFKPSIQVRETASDEFRALSTIYMDRDESPPDRDAVYIATVAAYLTEVLVGSTFHLPGLYENLLAFVALEETVAARQPRASCSKAYEVCLTRAVLQLSANKTSPAADLKHRVEEVERGLGMVLRLEEGEGRKVRMRAFKAIIGGIMSSAEANGGNGLKEVQAQYEWIASTLLINPTTAANYVAPLGQERFDKTVGGLLMNADVAVSMPELGETFERQVYDMAEELLIPRDQAEQRIVYLAGAVMSSLIELSLDQHNRMNYARTDAMLKKAHIMYKHPLLKRLQATHPTDILSVGIRMGVSRVGADYTMDLIRMLEAARLRGSGEESGDAGWGAAAGQKVDPELLDFIQNIKAFLLKEFTAGNLRR